MVIVLCSTLHSGTSRGRMALHVELPSSCLVLLFCLPLGRKLQALNTARSQVPCTDANEITAGYLCAKCSQIV